VTAAPTRYAFIKANWHAEIVDRALDGFCEVIPADQVDVFTVPGAFEMPLLARDLANSGKYAAVAAAALVVDGGIYRHDFVAQAVVSGLMQAGPGQQRSGLVGVPDPASLPADRPPHGHLQGPLRRKRPRSRASRPHDRQDPGKPEGVRSGGEGFEAQGSKRSSANE
jgi:hypothetical protein